jgi:hypothetical protein
MWTLHYHHTHTHCASHLGLLRVPREHHLEPGCVCEVRLGALRVVEPAVPNRAVGRADG